MLLSFKMNTAAFPVKTEGEEVEGYQEEDKQVPVFKDENFEVCGCCKIPFKGIKYFTSCGGTEGGSGMESVDEGEPRRGQLGVIEHAIGKRKKVREFYSFNVVTGELLHVTALQALLQVFQLRLSKCSPELNLQDVNANLAFCESCGTLISQLYKLYQEVSGLIQEGSIIQQLLVYEDGLTDNHEADFGNPKKQRKIVVNKDKMNDGQEGLEDMEEEEEDGGVTESNHWNGNSQQNDSTWNNDDDDYDMSANDDATYRNDEEEEDEVNVKPSVSARGRIKITSIESATANFDDDDYSQGSRSRRRASAKKVDYKKVLEGPKIEVDDEDDDEEWKEESRSNNKKGKTTARKKTGTTKPPPAKKARARSSKTPPAPSPKSQAKKAPLFKTPPEKSTTGTICQLCGKLYPASYLAEHMKLVHNTTARSKAGSLPTPDPQPCLICGRYFENSYASIKHLLTHVPEKAHGCTRCHSCFKSVEERNEHSGSHEDSDLPMQCPKCTATFPTLLLLNKHEAQKHRQTKSFLCSICAELMTGKDEWIQHILSHGPFQCFHCKVFLNPSEYKGHLRAMHGGLSRPKPLGASSEPIAEVTLD